MGRRTLDAVVDGGREDGLATAEETRAGLVITVLVGAVEEARLLIPILEEGVRVAREEGLVVESPLRGAAAVVVLGRGAREVEEGGGRASEEVALSWSREVVVGTMGFQTDAEEEEAVGGVVRTPLVRVGARRMAASAGGALGVEEGGVGEALGASLVVFGSPRSSSSSESVAAEET